MDIRHYNVEGKKYKFKIVWGRRRRDILFIYFSSFFLSICRDLHSYSHIPCVVGNFSFHSEKCLTDKTFVYTFCSCVDAEIFVVFILPKLHKVFEIYFYYIKGFDLISLQYSKIVIFLNKMESFISWKAIHNRAISTPVSKSSLFGKRYKHSLCYFMDI